MSFSSYPTSKVIPIAASEPYYNLGTFGRQISTTSLDAQTWFNRGLTWTYGFHHEEAILCFDQALLHDPKCVLPYLFLAYALGPNYNKTWQHMSPQEIEGNLNRIYQLLDEAEVMMEAGESLERGFHAALWERFPRKFEEKDFKLWNEAFVKGMKGVYDKYGDDDLDVISIYADSMMSLAPWRLWDLKTGEPSPGSPALIVREVLEKGMKLDAADTHPGILHFYIHLTEMSTTPERAIPAADKLYGLIPDSGHLNHMPSHLDILIGDYRRAIASNARAILADDIYLGKAGPARFYTIYRLHNAQSLVYAAMFNGQYKTAIQYVDKVESTLPEALVRGMPDFVEAALGTRVHVLIRFGRWQEILDLPLPEDTELFCVTLATIHYGRGIAFAATGSIDDAAKEQEAFNKAVQRVPESRLSFPNTAIDVMAVGQAMLAGELDYRRGNFDSAFEHLRLSIERYDNLVYGEPWSWMQPVRHAYAALQLERGNVEEALKTYAADLGYDTSLARACQHPNNVWGLHGYHECLTRLGRESEARIIEPQLRLALAIADVRIASSCFCRLETHEGTPMKDGTLGEVVETQRCCGGERN
jgi:tetratricopeptide (TPR) repeat protein